MRIFVGIFLLTCFYTGQSVLLLRRTDGRLELKSVDCVSPEDSAEGWVQAGPDPSLQRLAQELGEAAGEAPVAALSNFKFLTCVFQRPTSPQLARVCFA